MADESEWMRTHRCPGRPRRQIRCRSPAPPPETNKHRLKQPINRHQSSYTQLPRRIYGQFYLYS